MAWRLLIATALASSLATRAGATAPGPADWPTYGHDVHRTFSASTTLDQTLIANVPIVGRDAGELIKLMPGAVSTNGLTQGSSFSDKVVGSNTGPVGCTRPTAQTKTVGYCPQVPSGRLAATRAIVLPSASRNRQSNARIGLSPPSGVR